MWRAVLLRSEGTLVSTFMAPACRTASMTSSATISAVLDGQVGGVCVRARVHVLDYAHVHICTRWNVFGGRKSGQRLFVCFCVLCLRSSRYQTGLLQASGVIRLINRLAAPWYAFDPM